KRYKAARACRMKNRRVSILTYFKIGFWDGLSPNSGGGLFLFRERLKCLPLSLYQGSNNAVVALTADVRLYPQKAGGQFCQILNQKRSEDYRQAVCEILQI
ncbi:MAG: hypothetical protein KA165_01920, partial [Saprospiraceae bacterium]|nr:hypothetical protein [Saprospiraceae bacterium]